MAERRKTPDILTDLLGAGANAPIAPIEASRQTAKTSKRQTAKAAQTRTKAAVASVAPEVSEDEPAAEGKVKVTFYLSKGAVDALDDAHLSLRRMARSDRRGGVSKSLIIEEALKAATEELREGGSSSHLASKVL